MDKKTLVIGVIGADVHAVGNKIYDQFIRNEKSLIHISFCFLTEFGSVLDICPENVSC